MIRFRSIISRIVILHVIAVALTSVLMSLALSWLLNLATDNIHDEAMEKQAVSVADRLIVKADGRLSLELPPDLQGLYSQPYGRYFYAVVDDGGKALFTSLKGQTAIFPTDPKAANIATAASTAAGTILQGTLVAKEFTLEQRILQSGTVQVNKRLVAAVAETMDRLGDKFFSDARFARNED